METDQSIPFGPQMYPQWQEKTPHKASLAGFLAMGSPYLTLRDVCFSCLFVVGATLSTRCSWLCITLVWEKNWALYLTACDELGGYAEDKMNRKLLDLVDEAVKVILAQQSWVIMSG